MFTRKDYMNGKCTHEQYYEAIANEAGISYANSSELPRIIKALEKDEHLNNIPLREWDARAIYTSTALNRAYRKRGDYPTLAGNVCTHKAAAKKAARGA